MSQHSDIDLLSIVPKYIDRSTNFFIELYELLEINTNVKELRKVIRSKTPVINFLYNGIRIDLHLAITKLDNI
jgi:poly(A) polymerase Pap1